MNMQPQRPQGGMFGPQSKGASMRGRMPGIR
jgi:hypothetical protein